MCGICGTFGMGNKIVDSQSTNKMMDTLYHRGPDDFGVYNEKNVSLGMRRLSIIDIEGGKQPITNEDSNIVVFQNGEIFNYIELRDKLNKKSHDFRTLSDTEVILHAYEEYGLNFASELNGMFAIAVWDKNTKTLIITRDRLGIKPVYYALQDGIFYFASELKALLSASPSLREGINFESFAEYLALMYTKGSKTPFSRINKLLPGHQIQINDQGMKVKKWWDLSKCYGRSYRGDIHQASEQIWDILDDSIKLRMRSDIPVGCFLSGGLDSSAISVLSAKYSPEPIKTFCVGFEGSHFDETQYANEISRYIQSDHLEVKVSPMDALNLLPNLIWHLDEPIGDSAIIPTYVISKIASKSMKVILSGIGGDELFGGYDRFNDGFNAERYYRKLPRNFRKTMSMFGNLVLPKRLSSRLYSNSLELPQRYLQRLSIFDQEDLKSLFSKKIWEHSVSLEDEFKHLQSNDKVNSLLYVDSTTYLPDQILQLTDRLSMAASLEARTPFLDYRLVELAASLPSKYKVIPQSRQWKILLKMGAKGKIPKSVINRPKWGFGSPVNYWMNNGLRTKIENMLDNKSMLIQLNFIEPNKLKSYLHHELPGEKGKRNQRLWMLLVLETWLRVFINGTGKKPEFDLGLN